ncbi:MAG: squalene--hopene cyclase, partial [Planctomycetaceae bacterium]|nr:squalene--hopene cyclase [Planctomycetaceae bacterium]
LQNRDGGWPTFCRGWGKLPFDRSSCDLTAHVLRALRRWKEQTPGITAADERKVEKAVQRGLNFLKQKQVADGSWLPLWFGHQFQPQDENPLYGTAKVVLALSEIQHHQSAMCQAGVRWLQQNQNDDGGWSASRGLRSSVEETGLAVEALAAFTEAEESLKRGVDWLCQQVDAGTVTSPSPIGFYFAKLWYFEELYPLIFATAAIERVRAIKAAAALSSVRR